MISRTRFHKKFAGSRLEKNNKLVNGFLDGIIEKDVYLKKKNELIKQKIQLEQRQAVFGERAKRWVKDKKVDVAFLRPFDSLLSVKAVRGDVGGCGEGIKKGLPSKTERSPVWSDVLNEVRTFFEGEEGKNS